jgi:dolichyl-diphosphooligosaccharide--protein glycosyltransferase
MTQSSRYSLSGNLEAVLAFVLIVFTAVSVRLTEYPLWLDPAFFVNGEHLMATHDAYTWLAGAKGIGNYADHAFSGMLAIMHGVTGLDLATLGFWGPVILVPLLAIPVTLLARALKLPEGGLVFGILTTSGLGYLVRTRLGFCDTDLISLFFPLSVTCLVASGLAVSRQTHDVRRLLTRQELLGTLLAGMLGKIAVASYPSNATFLFITCAMALGLGLFLIPRERYEALCSAVLLMFALTFAGWVGAIVVGAWIVWSVRRSAGISVILNAVILAVATGIVLYLGNAHEVIWLIAKKLLFYAKTAAPDLNNATAAIKLPDIAQSVREAQNLDWSLLGPRMGGNWVVFILGIAGFGFVCWRRPALLMFLPFLILGFASVKLGNRFSMYGTIAIGMGIGLGLSELMLMLRQSQGRRWIGQLTMACVALWPSAQFMQQSQYQYCLGCTRKPFWICGSLRNLMPYCGSGGITGMRDSITPKGLRLEMVPDKPAPGFTLWQKYTVRFRLTRPPSSCVISVRLCWIRGRQTPRMQEQLCFGATPWNRFRKWALRQRKSSSMT